MVRRLPRTLGLLGNEAGGLDRQVYRDLQIEAPLHIHVILRISHKMLQI